MFACEILWDTYTPYHKKHNKPKVCLTFFFLWTLVLTLFQLWAALQVDKWQKTRVQGQTSLYNLKITALFLSQIALNFLGILLF